MDPVQKLTTNQFKDSSVSLMLFLSPSVKTKAGELSRHLALPFPRVICLLAQNQEKGVERSAPCAPLLAAGFLKAPVN